MLRRLGVSKSYQAALLIGHKAAPALTGKPPVEKIKKILASLKSIVKNPNLSIWQKRRAVRFGLMSLQYIYGPIRTKSYEKAREISKPIHDGLREIYRLAKGSGRASPIFDTDDDLIFDDKDKTPIPTALYQDHTTGANSQKEIEVRWKGFFKLIENDAKWKAFLKRIPEGSIWHQLNSQGNYYVIKKDGQIILQSRIFMDPETRSLARRLKSIEAKIEKGVEEIFNTRMPERGIKVDLRFIGNPYSGDNNVNISATNDRGRGHRWIDGWDFDTHTHEVGHHLGWPDRYDEFDGVGDQTFKPALYFLVDNDELMSNHHLPAKKIRKYDVRFSIAAALDTI